MKLSLTETERRIFRKREIPPVSRWAAQHLIVPDGPYAGARYRRDVNPYLAGIMDAFSERSVEEVVVCGAPQTGKTLCLYACCAGASTTARRRACWPCRTTKRWPAWWKPS